MGLPLSTFWNVAPCAAQAIRSAIALPMSLPVIEARMEPEDMVRVHGSAGVIQLHGLMMKSPGAAAAYYFGLADTAALTRAFDAAADMDTVEHIVCDVDTPGGSVDGLAEFGDAVFRARQRKPVTMHVSGMCASAGYYVASQATAIYANRMDLIGSIGTRMMLYDFHKMFETEGIEAIPIDTGIHKSAGAMGTEITEEQRAEFQRIVDAYFADFLAVIRRGRKIDGLKELADGRMFMAEEAVANGLIDGIRGIDQTLGEIEERRRVKSRRQQAAAWAKHLEYAKRS